MNRNINLYHFKEYLFLVDKIYTTVIAPSSSSDNKKQTWEGIDPMDVSELKTPKNSNTDISFLYISNFS